MDEQYYGKQPSVSAVNAESRATDAVHYYFYQHYLTLIVFARSDGVLIDVDVLSRFSVQISEHAVLVLGMCRHADTSARLLQRCGLFPRSLFEILGKEAKG